jgi:LCP family protein required for cell wall assembly
MKERMEQCKKAARLLNAFRSTVRCFRERKETRKRATTLKGLVSLVTAGIIAIGVLLLAAVVVINISSLTFPMILTGAGTPLQEDEQGTTTILLIGQGDGDHDGIDLTDSIQVASIDPKDTGITALLSLPRDLYFLKTEKTGPGRLNALWRDYRNTLIREEGVAEEEASMRSMQELKKEVAAALGIDIHYVVKADFTAFEKAINSLGGIDINVPEAIRDTEFPGPNWTFETFEIAAGPQRLDGVTALKYARSRHGSSAGDFNRSQRQQLILQSLLKKADEMKILRKPSKIREMLGILSNHIETDLTTRELLTIAGVVQKLDPARVVSFQLSNVNGLYGEPLLPGGLLYSPPRDLFNGASVLLPVSIPEFPITWKQVQAFAELIFHHRDIFVPRALAVAVLNGGAPPKSAAKLSKELKKFGFRIANIANAEEKVKQTMVTAGEEYEEAREVFAALFKAEALKEPTPFVAGLSPDDRGDITVILGPEYRFEPLQDAILAMK